MLETPRRSIPLALSALGACVLSSLAAAQTAAQSAAQEDAAKEVGDQPAAFLAQELEAPVLLCSDGKPIMSPTGYFCPLLVDLNGDGKLDLLAGEFGHGHERMGLEDKEFFFPKFFTKEKSPDGRDGIGNSAYVWRFLNETGENGALDFSAGEYVKTEGGGLAESPTW